MKKSVMMLPALLSIFGAPSLQAMPLDRNFSVYGQQAEAIFEQLPKLSPHCAYAQNSVTAEGAVSDTLNRVMDGEKINSLLCVKVGEQTFACEASTLWKSDPCKTAVR